MKITVEITPDKKLTLEAPLADMPDIIRNAVKSYETVQAAKAKANAEPKEPKLPRFIVSRKGCKPREIIASDAFTAAEEYACLTLPNVRGPWVHRERDWEKLRAFGSRFPHSVKSAERSGFCGITVKEVC